MNPTVGAGRKTVPARACKQSPDRMRDWMGGERLCSGERRRLRGDVYVIDKDTGFGIGSPISHIASK